MKTPALKYIDEIKRAMHFLADQPDTLFIGQSVAYKGNVVFGTLIDIAAEKKLELPVFEEVQMGMSIGLALEGAVPISVFPRFNFLLLAMNQLVNHLDKVAILSKGAWKPKVIIKTMVGSIRPLNPGIQHCGDFTEAFRALGMQNVEIVLRKNKKSVTETLLIKRKIYPEIGKWCLIGGRILKGELTNNTIKRQARNELGVSVEIIPPWNDITPFATYNEPVSDKQKHFVALTFPVIITNGTLNKRGPEFSEAKWFQLNTLPKDIGFHHAKVLSDFIKTKMPYNIK